MKRAIGRHLLVAAVSAIAVTVGLGAQAATPVGETQECVPLPAIKERLVIDNKTIVFRGYDKDGYKRVDLAEPCTGLQPWGERFTRVGPRHVNDFCVTDTLKVHGEVGFCKIDKIVSIDKAEALALLARR